MCVSEGTSTYASEVLSEERHESSTPYYKCAVVAISGNLSYLQHPYHRADCGEEAENEEEDQAHLPPTVDLQLREHWYW
ncbi:hypothetical protein LTR95_018771 [Oleoguttula sp. CCFEE 5521]